MTPSRTHRVAAFALSLMMTLVLFTAVSQRASVEAAGPWLVQQPSALPTRG